MRNGSGTWIGLGASLEEVGQWGGSRGGEVQGWGMEPSSREGNEERLIRLP